jgi:azurin
MKIRLPFALLAALLLVAWGKRENTPATVAAATAPASGSAPAASAASPAASSASTGAPAATASTPSAPAAAAKSAGGARLIEITANDQMKFSLATIEAKNGEELKVKLTNIGTLPKEAMGHNWVLLKPGTDPMAFGMASATAKDTDYIAPSMKDKVVAHTKILGPKQSEEVTFKVPGPGEYPFICSFPGHVALMKGILTVK